MGKIQIKIKETVLIYLKKRLKNIVITKSLSRYIDTLDFIKEDRVVRSNYSLVTKDPKFSYQTPFSEIKLIKLLVDLIKAKNILEIGT